MHIQCVRRALRAVWSIRAYVPCLVIDMFSSVIVASSALEPYSVYGCETGELCPCAQICYVRYRIQSLHVVRSRTIVLVCRVYVRS